MSDDLVKRLREFGCDWPYKGEVMTNAAANRIEALEAAIAAALRSRDEEMRDILRKGLHGETALPPG